MYIMASIKRKLNNTKMSKKLFISYFMTVVLPILLIGLFFTSQTKKIVYQQAMEEAEFSVARVEQRVTEMMNLIGDISNKLYGDQHLDAIISKEYTNILEMVVDYRSYEEFVAYRRLHKEINDIRVYTENPTLMENMSFTPSTPKIQGKGWYKEAIQNKGKLSWDYIYDEIEKDYYLCAIRTLANNKTQHRNILVISINTSVLTSVFEQEVFTALLLNEGDEIVVSHRQDWVGEHLGILLNEMTESSYNNQIVKPVKAKGTQGSFRIIGVFPVDIIMKKVNTISFAGFIFIGSSILIALVLTVFFSHVFSKRIEVLSDGMNIIAHGNLEYRSQLQGEDELGKLSSNLNLMVDSIQDLIEKVYVMDLQKQQLIIEQKEIQFQMLAHQINPHFLFNILESIRMQAHCSGDKEVATMIRMLGELLRRNLEVKDEAVSLEEELEFIQNYLEIQKIRFGDRINYQIQIEPSLQQYEILPLLIQPVVENAVIHGLENQANQGYIEINITLEKENVKITVKDNGGGIKGDQLQYLQQTFLQKDFYRTGRIGLHNVSQRIKLYYGEAYGLQVKSEYGVSTTVEILLPKAHSRK